MKRQEKERLKWLGVLSVKSGFKKMTITMATLCAMNFLLMTPVQADEMGEWKTKVAKLIAKNQGYPRSAQIRKLQGSAQVKLIIDGSGTISDYELLKSTEHAILDKEVDKLMGRLNPLPAPPMPDGITLVLPLTWRLQ